MAKTLSEQVAELERERDTHKARADHNYREFVRLEAELNAAGSRLADAERRGAREALTRLAAQTWAQVRPFPHDTSFDEMVLGFRDRKYPAVPPEREGAGTEGDVRCECGHRYAQHTHRGTACCLDSCSCIRFCPTSPVEGARPSVGKPYDCAKCEREGVHFVGCGDVNCEARPTPPQAAPEPRIAKPSAQVQVGQKIVQRWDSDGFGRTWYRVVQEGHPNRDYGEFRGLLHSLMSNAPMPTPIEYSALLSLAGDCQRIVETARRASGREDA